MNALSRKKILRCYTWQGLASHENSSTVINYLRTVNPSLKTIFGGSARTLKNFKIILTFFFFFFSHENCYMKIKKLLLPFPFHLILKERTTRHETPRCFSIGCRKNTVATEILKSKETTRRDSEQVVIHHMGQKLK